MLADSNSPGTFKFGSLTNFLTDQPNSFTAALPQATTERGFGQTIFGVYLQDDIRWRPNLTFNVGLRSKCPRYPPKCRAS